MTTSIPVAVFDCVVLLQAAVSKKGPASACMSLVESGRFRIVLSTETLAEITDVLNRPELQRKFKTLTPDVANTFLRALTGQADHLSDVPKVFSYLRDPDDEPYIDLAVAADARYLVTWDNDLLDLMDETTAVGSDFRQRFPHLRILTPIALIREISAPPNVADGQG
jgi:putative PIN family toxin of toxin-antitoxin system